MELAEIIAAYKKLPDDVRSQVEQDALKLTQDMLWVPNPGPQTDAYFCEADELFYGGQAGPGKTDLIIGLSLTCHERSLVLRRTNKEASKLFDRYLELIGTRDGWNGQDSIWRLPNGKVIDIGGCQLEEDKQKYKGNPHDLIGFDEISDFTESQYTFITIWNRGIKPDARCRVVAAGNPPTRPEGLWVIKYWGPWLDPTHPSPAQPGEIRWFLGGQEVSGPGPYMVESKSVRARSRTFIRGELKDNPDLAATGYDSVLAGLPEELRLAYREGRFDASLKDNAYQVIPTAWVRKAQARWKPEMPRGIPMCAMGVDVANGGDDNTCLAPRYDGWYPPLITVPGRETPTGSSVAGLVVAHRRDNATIVIDLGGGYGGAPYERLKENEIAVVGFKGAEKSTRRTKDNKLGFSNKRSEAYWKFREALDPDQIPESPIALPPDPTLVADLTAPTFEIGPHGIKVEPKDQLVKRLGRSPDRGDAVVMAWIEGGKMASHYEIWQADQRVNPRVNPKVNMGPRRR